MVGKFALPTIIDYHPENGTGGANVCMPISGSHGELSERGRVKVINRHVCRFAYKAVFAQEVGHEPLIRKYSNLSPTLRTNVIPHKDGEIIFYEQVFGERKRKPKWKG
jgi:hypothetical protein